MNNSGVEFELALKPVDSLDIRANYSLVNARIATPGTQFENRLALRPRDSANVTVDWQTPWKVSLGGSIALTGDSFDNLANTVRLDGYVLAGLRASVPIGEALEVYGRVDNLFDERYQLARGFGRP